MTLKNDAKFEEKLSFCFENDSRNLVSFNASSGKSENLRFQCTTFIDNVLCLSQKCTEELYVTH